MKNKHTTKIMLCLIGGAAMGSALEKTISKAYGQQFNPAPVSGQLVSGRIEKAQGEAYNFFVSFFVDLLVDLPKVLVCRDFHRY